MNRPHSISLIITTYNRPDALKAVLESVLQQTRLPEEVIIADDGSGAETFALIAEYQPRLNLIHAWQEDKGFRAARSRNNAIIRASSDYLIAIDGDCVLHPHFIADHIQLSEANVFTVGSRLLLNEAQTQTALVQNPFSADFYHQCVRQQFKSHHLPFLSNILFKKKNKPIEKLIFKIRSCNMAFWRADAEAVNGFNQDFEGWGREDSEFALRLFKKGLSLKHLKFAAIQYHLYHHEQDRAALGFNDTILNASLQRADFRCPNGIHALPDNHSL